MSNIIKAPWSLQEIENLNRFQNSNRFHPYTCGSDNRMDKNHSNGGILIATTEGWICSGCTYTQDWCLDIMIQYTEEIHNQWIDKINKLKG